MKITGLEGNSFSGKSTLAQRLVDLYGYKMVREPSCYVHGFPVAPKNLDEAKSNIRFFGEVEKRRSQQAIDYASQQRTVILDRTLWTYAHYEYCIMKRFPGRPNAFRYALDHLERLAVDGDILVPPILIALTLNSHEVFENRVRERGRVGVNFLNDWETTLLVDSFMHKVIGIYPDGFGSQICSSQDVEVVAKEAHNLICGVEAEADIKIGLAFNTLRLLASSD